MMRISKSIGEHPAQWPAMPWRLTAPESYALHYDPVASGGDAMQLALKELIVKGALRIEHLKPPWPFGLKRGVSALKSGPRTLPAPERPLAAALELCERARSDEGVLLKDFAKAARREFTRSFVDYLTGCVHPSLEQRGLLCAGEQERFARRSRRRYRWTAAGEEAAKELDEWLSVGRERMRSWVRDDPAIGWAYAQAAGASVLLLDSLYPELEKLARYALRPTATADSGGLAVGAGMAPAADSRGLDVDGLGDVGALDFSGLLGDFGGFEGLGDAFAAIDFGVGDGGGAFGGWGGGDGGGGS